VWYEITDIFYYSGSAFAQEVDVAIYRSALWRLHEVNTRAAFGSPGDTPSLTGRVADSDHGQDFLVCVFTFHQYKCPFGEQTFTRALESRVS
jgi:hypothetical protein